MIHFSGPVGHSRHYRGWTGRADVMDRFREHASGRGARLTRVAVSRGIVLQLVRTWPGGTDREKQLKLQGSSVRQCPVCTPMKRMFPEGYARKKP